MNQTLKTTPATALTTPKNTLTQFAALLRAEFITLRRNTRTLIWTIALAPFILIVGNSAGGDGSTAATLTIAAVAVGIGMFSLGLFGYPNVLATYREKGVFRRLRCAPIPAWAILGSKIVAQLVAVLLQTAIVLVVAAVFYGVSFSATGLVLCFFAVLLGGLTALACGQMIASLIASASSVNAVSRLAFIALVILGELPFWLPHMSYLLKLIATWSPISLSLNLVSGALISAHWNLAYSLALIGYIVVLTAISVRTFKWEGNAL
jgi:ABC-2 type transport system permease protein